MKKKNRDEPRRCDPWLALRAGEAFQRNAISFLSQIPDDLDTASKFTIRRLGEFTAAITNLALAIELFLKCLAIAARARVRTTHDLVVLFEALPPTLQAAIETRYRAKTQALPVLNAATELVVSARSDWTEAQMDEAAGKLGLRTGRDSVRELLLNEREAFEKWRYMYEGGPSEEITVHRVEHLYLMILAQELHAEIVPRILKQQPQQAEASGEALL